MNKIYHFILFCFATLCLAACSDDDPEVSGIDGKDHFISEFALTVDGITYQAMIVGDKSERGYRRVCPLRGSLY